MSLLPDDGPFASASGARAVGDERTSRQRFRAGFRRGGGRPRTRSPLLRDGRPRSPPPSRVWQVRAGHEQRKINGLGLGRLRADQLERFRPPPSSHPTINSFRNRHQFVSLVPASSRSAGSFPAPALAPFSLPLLPPLSCGAGRDRAVGGLARWRLSRAVAMGSGRLVRWRRSCRLARRQGSLTSSLLASRPSSCAPPVQEWVAGDRPWLCPSRRRRRPAKF